MNLLDILLIVGCASFAISGYRQGFVVGVLSFAGFLGGGALGMILAPRLVSGITSSRLQALVSIGIVFLVASLGQVVALLVGGQLRSGIRWRPARVLDSTLGALLSAVSVLLVAWFLASALRVGPLPEVSAQIRGSAIITRIDTLMPEQARTLFSSFRRVLDNNGFPQVFGTLAPETIVPVSPPTTALLSDPDVKRAGASIVKVVGLAVSCNRDVEGTGFVIAPHKVLTNAHVVAGVRSPTVQVGGNGRRYTGRVVYYNPNVDIAVIDVPGLSAPALSFAADASRGDLAVAAGFPLDGPYRLSPARVRDVIDARGPNIYDSAQVTRQIYSLYVTIEPGNSGGPLLAADGKVYGVVFAKSVDSATTGYALTYSEIKPLLPRAVAASSAVPTGACAN